MGLLQEKKGLKSFMALLGITINIKGIRRKLNNMKKEPALLGIDINDQYIAILELANDAENIKVMSYGMKKLPSKAIVNGDIKQPAVVSKLLDDLLKDMSASTKKVAIAVSGASVITKTIQMAVGINDDYLEAKIIANADKYIPYSLDDVAIDFSVVNRGDKKDGEVLLAACRKEVINQRVGMLSALGLEPEIVDIKIYDIERSFSLINKEYNFTSSDVIALFDLNTDLSLTIIKKGEAVYYKEESVIVSDHQLTAGKSSFINTKAHDDLQSVNGERGAYKEQLAKQMQSSIQFFISSSQSEKINYIFLAGNFISIKELSVWLSDRLKMPIRVANPLSQMAFSDTVNCQAIEDNAASLLVACGLAMRGLKWQ